jgi:hypothetical protein
MTSSVDPQAVLARLEQLERRSSRLERENRWLKRAAALAGVLVGAAVLLAAQEQNKPPTAEKFVLTDAQGRQRAWLGMDKDGPALRFLDENGRTSAGLSMGRDAIPIALYDREGRVQCGLAVERDGISMYTVGADGQRSVGRYAIKNTAGVLIPAGPAPRP